MSTPQNTKNTPKYKIGDYVVYKYDHRYYFKITDIGDNIYKYIVFNMVDKTQCNSDNTFKLFEMVTKLLTKTKLDILKAELL